MAPTYKDAGVDVEAGKHAVRLMRKAVESTHGPEVITTRADFGGLFALDAAHFREPVLVSGTDGVGTKLKIAFAMDKHDTVGVDLVAMCVNDIIVLGAKPLFFLDYFATAKLSPQTAAAVVQGIAEGCKQAGCALGFAVGIVERSELLDGSKVQQGDALVGIASSGLHSNGYSLVRRVLLQDAGMALSEHVDCLGCTLGEELLRPTRIYVDAVRALMGACEVHGIAHITGGGFHDNVERIMPDGLAAHIDPAAWPVPPVEMYRTFNMGIGLVAAVKDAQTQQALDALSTVGMSAWVIGQVVPRVDAPVMLSFE